MSRSDRMPSTIASSRLTITAPIRWRAKTSTAVRTSSVGFMVMILWLGLELMMLRTIMPASPL